MRAILNAIANTAIPVPLPIFIARNLILFAASVVCIYTGLTLPNLLLVAMGCIVLYMVAKGK
ncbi:hypothetical protein [Nitrospira sp. BLG_2]|uniref:hypothetical protein n=1 Tax=Nitrospira sp. BLG_2 TaxID=3397507 RepID=UPI003B9E8605